MKTLFALLLFSTSAIGQTPALIKSASTDDFIALFAQPDKQSATRSYNKNLRVLPKVELVIQFDLDSSQLKEEDMSLLNNLAKAMKNDRLTSMKFKVEGHTDTQGSFQYNLRLSQSRAESVIQYLTANGIENDRLIGEGKGFTDLRLPNNPKSAENRRVTFTVISR